MNSFEQMMDDNCRQPTVYKPGPYWDGYQKRIAGAIRRDGIEAFRSNPAIGKGFADTGLVLPEAMWTGRKGQIKRRIMTLPVVRNILGEYRTQLKAEHRRRDAALANFYSLALDNLDFPDTTAFGGSDGIEIDGQVVSRQYLECALRMQHFGVDYAGLSTVMEIGGGFGFFPHLLLHRYTNVRHVIYVDIPPMLHLATAYLREFVPVRDYLATRDASRIDVNEFSGVTCLCPWQIGRLRGSLDLLWSAASLSEMPPDTVKEYVRYTDPLQPKHICLVLNKNSGKKGTSTVAEVLDAFGGYFKRLAVVGSLQYYYRHLRPQDAR